MKLLPVLTRPEQILVPVSCLQNAGDGYGLFHGALLRLPMTLGVYEGSPSSWGLKLTGQDWSLLTLPFSAV